MHHRKEHSRMLTQSVLVVLLSCLGVTSQAGIPKKERTGPLGKAKILAHSIHAIFKRTDPNTKIDPKQVKVKVTVDEASAEANDSSALSASHDGSKGDQIEITHQELLDFVLTNHKGASVSVTGPNGNISFQAYPSPQTNEIVIHAEGNNQHSRPDTWIHDTDGFFVGHKN